MPEPARPHPPEDGARPAVAAASARPPLGLVVLAALLPMVVLGAVLVAVLSAERAAALNRALERTAAAAGTAVRQYVGEEIGRLEGLAVSSALDAADWAAFDREARRLLDRHPHWQNIVVTDDRRQVFNARLFGAAYPTPRDLDALRAVWDDRRPVVGDLAPGESGAPGTAFRVPVLRDGAMRFTLVAPVSPALFSRVLGEQPLPAGWGVAVTDRAGVVVGSAGPGVPAVGTRLEGTFADLVAAAARTAQAVDVAKGVDGHAIAIASGPPGWHVMVLAPAAAIGAPARLSQYALWAAVAAGAVLAVVLLGALVSATINRRQVAQLAAINARLEASEAEFGAIFEMAGRGKAQADVRTGRFVRVNRALCEITGYGRAELLTMTPADITHPDDREADHAGMVRLIAGEIPVLEREKRYLRKDGSPVWVRVNVVVLRDAAGRPTHATSVIEDITAQRHADARLRLLAAEVDHRAKNMLAVLQAVVRMTRANDVPTFAAVLQGRISALARAHTLLSETRWEGADLRRLVEEELAPYRRDERARVHVAGDALALSPGTAQAMAMVLHELATNAAKHGALAAPQGRVAVAWKLNRGRVVLQWTETADRPVVVPLRKGLGTGIIERTVTQQLEGEVRFDWRATGLICTIAMPAQALSPAAAASAANNA